MSIRAARSKKSRKNRMLRMEPLESRQLLSVGSPADVAPANLLSTDMPSPTEMAHYRRIDVNRDRITSPLDALHVINQLNQATPRSSADPGHRSGGIASFLGASLATDVNRDGVVSPVDALIVINDLKRHGSRHLPRYAARATVADDGTLLIDGTLDADTATVRSNGTEIVVQTITGDSDEAQTFQNSSVTNIVFIGYDGDDQFHNYTDINSYALGGGGDDVLAGGEGNDALIGGSGNDSLCGGHGNDTYIFAGSQLGSDTIRGEEQADHRHPQGRKSRDTLDFSQFAGAVSVDLGLNGEKQTVNPEHLSLTLVAEPYLQRTVVSIPTPPYFEHCDVSHPDISAVIENVVGSGFDDTIQGNSCNNVLDGGLGNDTLLGKGSADTLIGGRGDDTLGGGGGSDTYVFAGGDLGADVIDGESANRSHDTLDFAEFAGPVDIDLSRNLTQQIVNPEHLVLTLESDIENVVGTSYDDWLKGNGRDNVLDGRDGQDRLDGRDGADVLYGGDGDDELYDTSGVKSLLVGGQGDDTLAGGWGKDVLIGGRGDDVLKGGDGSDRYVFAGWTLGSDVIEGEVAWEQEDRDTLDFSDFVDSVRIDLGLSAPQVVSADRLVLTLKSAIPFNHLPNPLASAIIENVIGSSYDDVISGNRQNNLIHGGDGQDRITGTTAYDPGWHGRDALFGGDGHDTLYADNDDVANGGNDGDDYNGSALNPLKNAPPSIADSVDEVFGKMGRYLGRFDDTYEDLARGVRQELVDTFVANTSHQGSGGFGLVSLDDFNRMTDSFADAAQGVVGGWLPDLKMPSVYKPTTSIDVRQVTDQIVDRLRSSLPDSLAPQTVRDWFLGLAPEQLGIIAEFTKGVATSAQIFGSLDDIASDLKSSVRGIGQAFVDLTESLVGLSRQQIDLEPLQQIADLVHRAIVGTIMDLFGGKESLNPINAIPSIPGIFNRAADRATDIWQGLERSWKSLIKDEKYDRFTPPGAVDPFEPLEAASGSPVIMANGDRMKRSIYPLGDLDRARFRLTHRSDVVITTSGEIGDTLMQLYRIYDDPETNNGAAWQLVALDDDSGVQNAKGGFSSLVFTGFNALTPGDYGIVIQDDGDDDTIPEYFIQVNAAPSTILTPYEIHMDAAFGRPFRDAEKTPINDNDDNMCWAAAASNVLAWTGWGNVNGMGDEDQIFRHFQNHWPNMGGNPLTAWTWWFEGIESVAGGGYYKGVDIGRFIHETHDAESIPDAIQYSLRRGLGTTLSISSVNGGHSVTCWSIAIDPMSPHMYKGIWITDSDSIDRGHKKEYYDLEFDAREKKWVLKDYGGFSTYYIVELAALERRPGS